MNAGTRQGGVGGYSDAVVSGSRKVNVIARYRRTFLAALVAALSVIAGHVPAQAANEWGDEILYFVLIDRYANGDRANDVQVDVRNPGAFHGGDLKGLASRLDELADLGITAIWINPVQKQMPRGVFAQAPARLRVPDFMHWG
ncbi:MAG: hypothetical protein HZC22_15315, partial [Rhodocyclales bacterium]|nr:hypothetical protein [Rhodocyclales bacterium]